MTLKYIIICAPEIRDQHAVKRFFGEKMTVLRGDLDAGLMRVVVYGEIFPEATAGAVEVRGSIEKHIEEQHRVVFLTRYDVALNHVGNLIAVGMIKHDEVAVHLLRYENEQPKITSHAFTTDGFMDLNWPYGILT